MITPMAPVLDDLRAAAKGSGRTQAGLARALGLSGAHVCQFLAGTKGLSVEAAERLAALLGLEIVTRRAPGARPGGARTKGRGK